MHRNAHLAVERRRHLFERIGEDIATIIAFDPANKAYLTGYHSMTHDVAPSYRSAAIATRDGVCLVASAGDAGPALEIIGDPDRIIRYGSFYFGDTHDRLGFDRPGFDDFPSALTAALATMHKGGLIGSDDHFRALPFDKRAQDLSTAFQIARTIKLPSEIEILRKAARITEQAIQAVEIQIRTGMTELEVAALIGQLMISSGGIPRFISVTSGPRSALADTYPTARRIAPGDLVRLDIGCMLDGYWSDLGRTMVVGEPSPLQRERYKAIASGLRAELDAVCAGVYVSELFQTAVKATRRAGIPTYNRHHCGHGIGLAGYEHPLIGPENQVVLEKGMVLCLETPFYEIGWGGMMVEDTIVVSATGYDSLSTLDHELKIIPDAVSVQGTDPR